MLDGISHSILCTQFNNETNSKFTLCLQERTIVLLAHLMHLGPVTIFFRCFFKD